MWINQLRKWGSQFDNRPHEQGRGSISFELSNQLAQLINERLFYEEVYILDHYIRLMSFQIPN